MTRIGINPGRGKVSDRLPARITVCVLTCLPDLTGYFEQRLEVLKLVFASLQAHTTPEHDLLVFDNGSCSQVVEFLLERQQAGEIDYLILSPRNIGKIDALKVMFQASPGEVIAYSDDDILFYPGWLGAHLEVLEQFSAISSRVESPAPVSPGKAVAGTGIFMDMPASSKQSGNLTHFVGPAPMVSGIAVRNAAGHARASLEKLAADPPPGMQVIRERRIPDAWEADWAASTGRDPQAHLEKTRSLQDLVFRIEKPGGGTCEAIGSANHFQFVVPKRVILQALPPGWTGKLMGSMIELDEAMDRLGCLRLSTVKRYTRHMGNALSDELLGEVRALGLAPSAASSETGSKSTARPAGSRRKHWMLRLPGSRRILSGLYNRIFDILYR